MHPIGNWRPSFCNQETTFVPLALLWPLLVVVAPTVVQLITRDRSYSTGKKIAATMDARWVGFAHDFIESVVTRIASMEQLKLAPPTRGREAGDPWRRTIGRLDLSSTALPPPPPDRLPPRFLSKHDPEIRPPLANFGAVPLLERDSSDTEVLENASAALLNLSISAREAVILLSVDEYRPIIGSKRPLISALSDLFRRPSGAPTRSIKDALKAIFLLALCPLNRATLVEQVAVISQVPAGGEGRAARGDGGRHGCDLPGGGLLRERGRDPEGSRRRHTCGAGGLGDGGESEGEGERNGRDAQPGDERQGQSGGRPHGGGGGGSSPRASVEAHLPSF
ncbi:hypothetical protein ZIOFF_036328 [Zingiber officinale]|uniref:Uncharacterized protein n=1 Tax=Zingiber officinale TaxID=94328 RepID=A0A8J5GI16_ZINOF|nr:hypothetical protein ZIOFF_036328 [Zingiber officinale]